MLRLCPFRAGWGWAAGRLGLGILPSMGAKAKIASVCAAKRNIVGCSQLLHVGSAAPGAPWGRSGSGAMGLTQEGTGGCCRHGILKDGIQFAFLHQPRGHWGQVKQFCHANGQSVSSRGRTPRALQVPAALRCVQGAASSVPGPAARQL